MSVYTLWDPLHVSYVLGLRIVLFISFHFALIVMYIITALSVNIFTFRFILPI